MVLGAALQGGNQGLERQVNHRRIRLPRFSGAAEAREEEVRRQVTCGSAWAWANVAPPEMVILDQPPDVGTLEVCYRLRGTRREGLPEVF